MYVEIKTIYIHLGIIIAAYAPCDLHHSSINLLNEVSEGDGGVDVVDAVTTQKHTGYYVFYVNICTVLLQPFVRANMNGL